MSGEAISNFAEIERGSIDAVKAVIKDTGVLTMAEGEERSKAADRVIESLGVKSVDDLKTLEDKMADGSVSEDGKKRTLRVLGTAIAESIDESGDSEIKTAIIAGSFSLESHLPVVWQHLSVSNEEGDTGLAGIVVESSMVRISESKRGEIQSLMDIVDFYKNNPDYGSLLSAQLEDTEKALRKMLTPLNRGEMEDISKRLGYLKTLAQDLVPTTSVEHTEPLDYSAVVENNSNREGYRSPFENTPPAIVDAMFNYEPPRLYLTPPPEWWKKLSAEEQYMWKIQQKLANGIARKLAVKDISAEDARKNEVYNLSTMELRMLYEVPEIRESMETFVQDLFEFYEEDGRKFLRLKLVKNADGSLKKDDKGGYILDPEVAKKVGDIGTDNSFELYKEEMFKKMALKKLYPTRTSEIDADWKLFYQNEILAYINKSRENPRNRNKTNAELEGEWITINALEEKRAVATAWNLLCVGNIIESADTCRHLKPTQLNSDKIRTMMMPLEKFIGKSGMRRGELKGDEELFGGKITLWAKRRFEQEGATFAERIVYAADHDIRTMTPEQAKWRLFPKRMMCSFNDMYLAETESGEKITLSQALMEKKKIVFKDDDADVFVSLRDTWDEVITVTPFMIGKGEYSPIQQGEKFASAIEKWRGLVTGINRIKLSDGGFSHEITPERPEFYAWLLANAVGLELNLDIPILDRKAFKADKDTYNDHVDNMIRLLDLSPAQSSEVRRILSAQGWISSRNALTNAERRASFRETARRRAEKRA